MRIVKIGFVGFLVSFLLAVLLSQSVWLEMRIHVGKLIPWLVLLCIFPGFAEKRQRRFSRRFAPAGGPSFDLSGYLSIPMGRIDCYPGDADA